MQKWFALSNFNSFYEVSQNMFIFKLVNYTMIISSDLYLKRAKLDSQWYRVYLYLINDLKIPAFSFLVNVYWTCNSINGRSLEITSLLPLWHTLEYRIQQDSQGSTPCGHNFLKWNGFEVKIDLTLMSIWMIEYWKLLRKH